MGKADDQVITRQDGIAPARGLARVAVLDRAWRDPVEIAGAFADEPGCVVLLSDGSLAGRWSYVMRQPVRTLALAGGEAGDAMAAVRRQLDDAADFAADGPPLQGGVVGVAAYEFGARLEPAMPQERSGWPDLSAGLYDAVLAFDHAERRVLAVGRGATVAAAQRRALAAAADIDAATALPRCDGLAQTFDEIGDAVSHAAAVADVTARIAAGEIFQANIARRWRGRLAAGARPFDVFAALAKQSAAPFAAYLRLDGRALVSNSPERFLAVDRRGAARTWPIKGTRPRGATPDMDARLAGELMASAKDRAENLMIVDLMRNDLARACTPGSVGVPVLCDLESFANVHHLVSRVEGRLAEGRDALDLFAAAFPPGSITGAPKIQAMQVIARHEPPRGPFFGSLFWAGLGGGFDSSVLIRTLAFEQAAGGWDFEARAGGGVVADSDPIAESEEAAAKLSAIRGVLKR